MDEPFSGLDSRLKDAVRAETLDILRESRATAIVVTHDAEEAMRMGDRIALLRTGRLVQVGRAEELYQRPADLFVAGFFSELNLFEARVAGGTADTPVGRVAAPGFADGARADRCRAHSPDSRWARCAGARPARMLTRRYPRRRRPARTRRTRCRSSGPARVSCGALTPGVRDIWSRCVLPTYLCLNPAAKTHRSGSRETVRESFAMGSFSIWHWLIVLVVVLLLFGRGKIPELMGDMAKGIKSFKKGMADDDAADDAKTVEHRADETVEAGRRKGQQELSARTL
jgi:TatA/E family protein of Tat protein translocase